MPLMRARALIRRGVFGDDCQVARSPRARPGAGQRFSSTHENPRVSGESHSGEVRRTGAAGRGRRDRRRSRAGREQAGRQRRRSSRRRFMPAAAARAAASSWSKSRGRGAGGGRADPRHEPGDPPDRSARASGSAACSSSRDSRSRASFISGIVLDRVHREAGADGQPGRRRRDREGRRGHAGEDPQGIHQPGVGLAGFQARKLAFALGLEAAQIGQAVKFMMAVWEAFRSDRRLARSRSTR